MLYSDVLMLYCCDEQYIYGRLPVDGRSSVAPLGKFLYIQVSDCCLLISIYFRKFLVLKING